MRLRNLILSTLLAGATLVQAQDTVGRGLGAVPVPLTATLRDTVVCDSPGCGNVERLLLPTLFSVNPLTLAIEPASENTTGLVTSVYDPAATTQVLTLRDDLTWSDSHPVTAYDVLYTYVFLQGINGPFIVAMRVVDDTHLEVVFRVTDCAVPALANFTIRPYHEAAPDFREAIQAFDFSGDPEDRMNRFVAQNYVDTPSTEWVDGGIVLDNVNIQREVIDESQDYFWQLDESPVSLLVGLNDFSRFSTFDRFMWQRLNFLVSPPRYWWDELRARPDVDITPLPALERVYMVYPLADPTEPNHALDRDGNPIEQGNHPIFSDVRVRQAMQLAVDVPSLIDTVLNGHGTPLASYQPPASWAFDATLLPIANNLKAARRLLDEAGWRDTDGNGILNCVTCDYAEPDTELAFALNAGDTTQSTAYALADQLRRVGIRADVNYGSIYDVVTGSAALVTEASRRFDADSSRRFSTLADTGVLGNENFGSYANEEVERLLAEARSLPGCPVPQRAALYQQVDRLYQQDPPALWLYSVNDIIASRGIAGIVPSAYNALWNVETWKVRP